MPITFFQKYNVHPAYDKQMVCWVMCVEEKRILLRIPRRILFSPRRTVDKVVSYTNKETQAMSWSREEGKKWNCIFLRPDSQRCREALPERPKANWFWNWFAWNVVFLSTPNILQNESERENLLFDHLIELTMLYRFTLCDSIYAENRGGRGWGGCDRGGGWEAWACLGRRQGGRGCRGKGSWSESQLARPPPPPLPHSPPGQGGGRWWGWQGGFSLVGGRTRSWASEEADPLDKLAPLIIFKKI